MEPPRSTSTPTRIMPLSTVSRSRGAFPRDPGFVVAAALEVTATRRATSKERESTTGRLILAGHTNYQIRMRNLILEDYNYIIL